MNVELPILNILLAVALPALVALVTQRYSAGVVKSVVLLALSAVAVIAQQAVDTGADFYTISELVKAVFVQFLLAVGTHYGLLKPAKVTGDRGLIQERVPAGIGQPLPAR